MIISRSIDDEWWSHAPVTQPTIYNNVQFKPPKANVWYRSKCNGRCTHSDIEIRGGKRFSFRFRLSLAYFTSDRSAGYTCTLYRNGIMVDCRDLKFGNHIKATNIASAEKQALQWARNLNIGV